MKIKLNCNSILKTAGSLDTVHTHTLVVCLNEYKKIKKHKTISLCVFL